MSHIFKKIAFYKDQGFAVLIRKTADYLVFLLKKHGMISNKKICLKAGRLSLFYDGEKGAIFYDDKALTKDVGLHTAYMRGSRWYDSSKSRWRIKRLGKNILEIKMFWDGQNIEQDWKIELNNNMLLWEIDTVSHEGAVVEDLRAGLILSEYYREWFNAYEEGNFNSDFSQWREVFLKAQTSNIFGVKDVQAGNKRLPGIFFEIKEGARPYIQSSDSMIKGHILQAYVKNTKRPHCIKLMIKPDLNSVEIKEYIKKCKQKLIDNNSIIGSGLRIFAHDGKIRCFWNENEISRDIGLHAVIKIKAHEHDSSCALWDIQKKDGNLLQISQNFTPLPLVLQWQIKIKENNMAHINIKLQILEDMEILEQKAGIILASNYCNWFNSFVESRFIGDFNKWAEIELGGKASNVFGVHGFAENSTIYPNILFQININGRPFLQKPHEKFDVVILQSKNSLPDHAKKYTKGEYIFCDFDLVFTATQADIDSYIGVLKPLTSKTGETHDMLFADYALLHNRITQRPNDFTMKTDFYRQNQGAINIGVTRYNFYRLPQIIEYCYKLRGKQIDLGHIKFNCYPVKEIMRNFIEYLEELKKAVNNNIVRLMLTDEQLYEILTRMAIEADDNNQKHLLRLLGLICEHTFIGPQIVVIDPYHRCNANCIHCWVHTPVIQQTEEFLNRSITLDKFKTIADDLAELKVDTIIFQGDGEPLMHKPILEMMKYARNKGIQVSFFTNGIALNSEVAKQVVVLGINEIFCSLPAGAPQTYASINKKQPQEVLNKILENLNFLTQLKKEHNSKFPRLIMTHVIHNMNYKELMLMAENDVEIGADAIRFYLVRLDDTIKFLQLNPGQIKTVQESLNAVKEYIRDKNIELLDTTDFQLENYEPVTGSWSKDVFLKQGCPIGWYFCLLPAKLDISLCCHLRTVGYLDKDSFKNIWGSDQYREYRYRAKYLSENKNFKFLNDVNLFDEHCQHCDTHQVIRNVYKYAKQYGLTKYINS